MKKRLPYTAIAILAGILLQACSYGAPVYLSTVQLNGKYGCIDTLGKEVIPLKYDDMGEWEDNLVPVNIGAKEVNYILEGGKWGFCNPEGKLAIPLQYEKANRFSEHLAAVRVNGKWGFINTDGKMVITPTYDEAGIFYNGSCPVCKNQKWGIIDKTGKIIIGPKYAALNNFDHGVAIAFIGHVALNEVDKTHGYFCLIDEKGNQLTQARYAAVTGFYEGLSSVSCSDSACTKNKKSGFINLKGEELIAPVYDKVGDFNEGMAPVGLINIFDTLENSDPDIVYGYVNKDGASVIPIQFSHAGPFINGRAVVTVGEVLFGGRYFMTDPVTDSIMMPVDNHKDAVIDKNGQYIIAPKWSSLQQIDTNYYIAQWPNFAKFGVIHKNGIEVIPFIYRKLTYISNNILLAENKNEELVMLDLDNQVLLKTKKYQSDALSFKFSLIQVNDRTSKKSGFINLSGEEIIKTKYDFAGNFEATE